VKGEVGVEARGESWGMQLCGGGGMQKVETGDVPVQK
jgi:hypothetical protein